jgi:hypothetical protein
VIEVAWPGAVASAVTLTVALSRLSRTGIPLETAWILYVYAVPSTVAVSL